MILTKSRPKLMWISSAITVVLLAIAAIATTAGGSRRASVYTQLQRPATLATISVGPRPIRTLIQARPYGIGLRMTPNAASRRNQLSVVVQRDGRAVTGARVIVTYSMPAMNMRDVFTARLGAGAGASGTHAATQPVFGMPGVWQLQLAVTPPHATPSTLTIDDRMAGVVRLGGRKS